MQPERVRLERAACVATLVLNRPEVRNALDSATVAELTGRLRDLDADPQVRVVVLAGEGSCFSAGADLRAMRAMGGVQLEDNLADTRGFVEMLRVLSALSKPTLARVHGASVAGGVGLVACCDIALASDDAYFRLSEVRLGLVPAMVGPYLVEALGPRVARRLMLTAERFDARQAEKWGLVHEVHRRSELLQASDAMVLRLLRGAPGAQAICKDLVREIADAPLDHAIRDRTAVVLASQRSSAEGRAGVRAFFQKAQPPWAAAGEGKDECGQGPERRE